MTAIIQACLIMATAAAIACVLGLLAAGLERLIEGKKERNNGR